MNIIFVTEINMFGKVPENFNNLRTEFAWMKMLDAFHLSYFELFNRNSRYKHKIDEADLLILIPSKNNPRFLEVALMYQHKNIAIMQEGPNNIWQDWDVYYQRLYLLIINHIAKIVFCHNEYDKKYFEIITKQPVIILPTVNEVKKYIKKRIPFKEKESCAFIGGNTCRWYNGMNSFLISSHLKITRITFPSMGRKKSDEQQIMEQLDKRVNYIPYLPFSKFLDVLTNYKYAVHLMPEVAAGSFSLNCAMLGIPCIGNFYDDTQRKCFPDLSININDIGMASFLLNKLITDEDFYKYVVEKAIESVKEFDIDFQRDEVLYQIDVVLNKKYKIDETFRMKDDMPTGTPTYSPNEIKLTKKRYEFILDYNKNIFKGKRVMDAGCGWGLGSKLIVDNGAIEVIGIDVHPDTIRIANLKYPDPKITYLNDYIKKDMFNKKSIDIIVAVEFIEHLSKQGFSDFINICKESLVEKGLLYITTPQIRGRKEDYPKGSHYTEYDSKELQDLLEKNGFEQIWIMGTDLTKDTGFAVLFELRGEIK